VRKGADAPSGTPMGTSSGASSENPFRDPARGTVLGAVLAGGKSRRFGGNKALAPFRGQPLVLRAVRTLEQVCPEVVVVTGDPAIVEAVPTATLPDEISGAGPLGGLHAALRSAETRGMGGVLLLGCDMPLVPPSVLARVRAEGEGSLEAAVVPDSGGGRWEPLCAWYSVACLPEAEARLTGDAGGDRSLLGLLQAVGARVLPFLPRAGDPPVFRSANTREDLQEMERLAGNPGPDARGGGPPALPVVCVVGLKDSGKTGVAVGLVQELRQRGLRVGAVKHGHGFRLDTPGTDSWRLRHEAGADPVLLTGPEGYALMGGWEGGEELSLDALLERHFSGMDLVVVEGFKGSGFPRVEVFRPAAHPEPIHRPGRPGPGPLLALVTDAPDTASDAPVVPLDHPRRSSILADRVLEALRCPLPVPPSSTPGSAP
jgi:molybdopterin-guanine dinucleotide biosynthesis protein MobB